MGNSGSKKQKYQVAIEEQVGDGEKTKSLDEQQMLRRTSHGSDHDAGEQKQPAERTDAPSARDCGASDMACAATKLSPLPTTARHRQPAHIARAMLHDRACRERATVDRAGARRLVARRA